MRRRLATPIPPQRPSESSSLNFRVAAFARTRVSRVLANAATRKLSLDGALALSQGVSHELPALARRRGRPCLDGRRWRLGFSPRSRCPARRAGLAALVRGRDRRFRPRFRPRRRAPTGRTSCRRSIGSGAALFDFNNDGRLDILLLKTAAPTAGPNAYFKQMPDGRFKDVSTGSGLDFAGYNMGVAVGDVNNDGRPDVLVTQYGGVKLFLNNGDGTFNDVTREAGLQQPAGARRRRSSTTTATAGSTSSSSTMSITTRPCLQPRGRRGGLLRAQRPSAGTVTNLYHNRRAVRRPSGPL